MGVNNGRLWLKGLKHKNNISKEKQFMTFLKSVAVFTLDSDAITEAAGIYAETRKNGTPVGDADILIAAIVISRLLTSDQWLPSLPIC